MKILIVVVVDTKPKGVFKLWHIVATGETNIVGPRMLEAWILRQHFLMDAWVHDAIKSRNLQERPCFVTIQNYFTNFGIDGIERTLGLQGWSNKEANTKKKDDSLQNGNFSANLQISYEMDLTPRISTRKKTDSLGPIAEL